jgi:hypothetical protein
MELLGFRKPILGAMFARKPKQARQAFLLSEHRGMREIRVENHGWR